jgi:hypothetical protein
MEITINTFNVKDHDQSVIDDLEKIAYKTIETINKEDMGFTFNEDLTIFIEKSAKAPNRFDNINNTVYLYMKNTSLKEYKNYISKNLRDALGVPEYYTRDILYNKLKKYSSQEPISAIFKEIYTNKQGLGICKDILYIPKDMVINTPPNILHDIITNLIKFRLTNDQ